MQRTFEYTLEDENGNELSTSTVGLTTYEIECAATLEIVQTGSNNVLLAPFFNSLLVATDNRFKFAHPLGESREVKVALSGLFGRFVARAFFTHHLGFSIFCQTRLGSVDLGSGAYLDVIRTAAGDLPDWISLDLRSNDMVAIEAKGTHDRTGPLNRLEFAWRQAQRITFSVGGYRPNIKRYAIANRWAVAGSSDLDEPLLRVRDPRAEGNLDAGTFDQIALAYYRQQSSDILKGLGHTELAKFIREPRAPRSPTDPARPFILDSTPLYVVPDVSVPGSGRRLVGNCVSSFGIPSAAPHLTEGEIALIAKIDPNAKFVGLDYAFLEALITGDVAP